MAFSQQNDESRIMGILNQNSDKNFVQRILKPEGKPTLDLGGDNFATHKMAWSTVDGKPIVYPTVVQDSQTGKLKELSSKDAVQHALKNNEFITSKNGDEAEWLSSNYKKVWNIDGKNITLKKDLGQMSGNNQDNLEQLAMGLAQDQTQQQPKDLEKVATGLVQQQTPTPMQPITAGQRIRDILATPGETLLEAGQRLGTLEQKIPGVMPLARRITGLLPESVRRGTGLPPEVSQRLGKTLRQEQDIAPQATTAARVGGGLLGDITALELTGGAAEPALGALKIPGIIARPIAQTLGGAATSPAHPLFGAIAAGTMGTGLEAAKMAKFLPKLTLGGLGKSTLRSFENMKAIGKHLYDKTFEGIGHIKVQLPDETENAIKEVEDAVPKSSDVKKAIDAYRENPTIEGMHKLKSSIGERESSHISTVKKSGSNTTTDTELPALTTARKSIAKTTREYLGIISPEKQKLYDQAQAHWRQNVIPFREFPVIRTLTGKQRIAKPGLFREFSEKVIPKKGAPEAPTEALRRIVGVPRGVAQTGRMLHHKIGGVPLGVWLGIAGAGALGGGEIARRQL